MDHLVLLICLVGLADILHASPTPDPPVFWPVPTYPSECYLPPNSGACHGDDDVGDTDTKKGVKKLTRYYFDAVTEDCYAFAFLMPHCSKNANNFASMDKCKQHCQHVQS